MPASGPRIASSDAGRDVARDDRVRHAGKPAVPEMHVGAAHLRARRAQQRGAGRQIGTRRTRGPRQAAAGPASRRRGCGRSRCTLPLKDDAGPAAVARAPRRNRSSAYHPGLFDHAHHRAVAVIAPLWPCWRSPSRRLRADLSRQKAAPSVHHRQLRLALHAAASFRASIRSRISSARRSPAAQFEAYRLPDPRRRDPRSTCSSSSGAGTGAGVTLYPFGLSVGPTLGAARQLEDLPDIRIAFAGAGAPPAYELTGAPRVRRSARRSSSPIDRPAGASAATRSSAAASDGSRATRATATASSPKGGGGLSSGPFGVELAVKFAWNHLTEPVDHHFITVPVTLRGTLTF